MELKHGRRFVPRIKSELDKQDADSAWKLLGQAAECYLRDRSREVCDGGKSQSGRQGKPRFQARSAAAPGLSFSKADAPATAQLTRLHKCMRQIRELSFKRVRLLAGQSSLAEHHEFDTFWESIKMMWRCCSFTVPSPVEDADLTILMQQFEQAASEIEKGD